jgi:hypothetical protein
LRRNWYPDHQDHLNDPILTPNADYLFCNELVGTLTISSHRSSLVLQITEPGSTTTLTGTLTAIPRFPVSMTKTALFILSGAHADSGTALKMVIQRATGKKVCPRAATPATLKTQSQNHHDLDVPALSATS